MPRILHSFWKEGQFEVVSLPRNDINCKKRIGAFCKVCSTILKNTTKSRLVAHR